MGVWKEEVAAVEGIITEYFGGLFQTTNPAPNLIDEIFESVVTPAMN